MSDRAPDEGTGWPMRGSMMRRRSRCAAGPFHGRWVHTPYPARGVCVMQSLEPRLMLDGTTYVVDSLGDLVAWDGMVTLREAVQAANNNSAVTGDVAAGSPTERDIITFDRSALEAAAGAGNPMVIHLGGTRLAITDDLTIRGLGADSLIVDADGHSRVLQVSGSNTHAEILGLTLTGGATSSNDGGGGIYNSFATLTLVSCTVRGNAATGAYSDGGGIHSYQGALTMINCVVSENSVTGIHGDGGGIYNSFGSLTMLSCTVGRNAAEGYNSTGGGIYNSFDTPVTLHNSIVSGNTASGAADCWGRVDAESSLIGIDPGFVDPAGGDFRLTTSSIAIDAGDDSLLPADTLDLDGDEDTAEALPMDAAGATRVASAQVDLGAFEFQGAPGPREAASSVVTTLADVTDSTDGETSLREAMAYAMLGESSDMVLFAAGLAGGTIVLAGRELTIHESVTVDAPAAGMTIDAVGQSGVLLVTGGATQATLRDLEITGGHTARSGGGILNFGSVLLSGCDVHGNTATASGTQSFGGGIHNSRAAATLVNSSVRDNAATGADGRGGGIHGRSSGALTLINSVVANNAAGMDGGGIAKDSAVVMTLSNSTVAGNTAGRDGGGVYSPGPATLHNSIVAGNAATNAADWWGRVDARSSLIGIDPGFADAAGGDFSLASTSIAINAGDNALLPADATDLDNDDDTTEPLPLDRSLDHRVAGAAVDLGAYESQAAPGLRETPSSVVTTFADVVDSTDAEISLREALAYSMLGAAGGTVTFAPCLWGGSVALSGEELLVYASVAVYGGSAGITIDAAGQSRALWVTGNDATTVALRNLEIAGGQTARSGGAILNGASLSLTNCTIRNSTAEASGGGILNDFYGTLSLTRSTLRGNRAADDGGGVANDSDRPVMLTNSVFVGNSAGISGAGICNGFAGDLTLVNSTVSGNEVTGAHGDGGGICNLFGSSLTLHNTVVALNEAASNPDVAGTYTADHSLVGADPGFVRAPDDGGDGWGDDPATPGTDESANDDYGALNLVETGAAVDAGDGALLPEDACDLDGDGDLAETLPIDLAGAVRVRNGVVDVGAYEYGPGATPTGSLAGVVWRDDNADGVCDGPEPGIAGTRVYVDLDDSGVCDPDEPVGLTDADGVWEIGDLAPGEYAVRMIPRGRIVPVSAEASSMFSPSADPPTRMIDSSGLVDGLHGTNWMTMWLTAAGDTSPTVRIGLGNPYVLTGLLLWNYNQAGLTERGFASMDVWVSETGLGDPQSQPGEWTRIADDLTFDEAPGTNQCAAQARALDDAGSPARWIHLDDIHTFGAASGEYAGLSEIRFTQEAPPLTGKVWEQTHPADDHVATVFGRRTTGGVNFGTTYPASLPGDANGDGAVSDADYTVWADHYGTLGATWSTGDFNNDGAVTDADYTIWADRYGSAQTAPAAAAQSLSAATTAPSPSATATPGRPAARQAHRVNLITGPLRQTTEEGSVADDGCFPRNEASTEDLADGLRDLMAILSIPELL